MTRKKTEGNMNRRQTQSNLGKMHLISSLLNVIQSTLLYLWIHFFLFNWFNLTEKLGKRVLQNFRKKRMNIIFARFYLGDKFDVLWWTFNKLGNFMICCTVCVDFFLCGFWLLLPKFSWKKTCNYFTIFF